MSEDECLIFFQSENYKKQEKDYSNKRRRRRRVLFHQCYAISFQNMKIIMRQVRHNVNFGSIVTSIWTPDKSIFGVLHKGFHPWKNLKDGSG